MNIQATRKYGHIQGTSREDDLRCINTGEEEKLCVPT